MTRPRKHTVDFFPHVCDHGKTLFIIEQRYGNDGYAFWFKTLELLGNTEDHYIDCNDDAAWEFLVSKTRLTSDFCTGLLDLLAKLDAIDRDLWSKRRIIWSQNFVDGIKDVYAKRNQEVPKKPLLEPEIPIEPDNGHQKSDIPDVSDTENPQSKVNKSKPPISPKGDDPDFEIIYQAYPKHIGRKPALKAWLKLNGTRPPPEIILKAIEVQKKTDEWQKEGGKYIPHLATWLNAERWNDEVEPPKPKSVFS